MNRIEKMEKEFLNAIKIYPQSADLYNDYAMFLYRYKNEYNMAVRLLAKAIRLNPENRIYKYNYNKVLHNTEIKFANYHNFLVLLILGIMCWLSINGYHNFLNMFSLFLVAQIVINYQRNLYKKYN